MQREIKFRAWLENIEKPGSNEHMIYGLDKEAYNLFLENAIKANPEREKILRTENGIRIKGGFVYRIGQFFISASNWLGKAHIMQWTGLRDKEGKEIYEGDRVRYLDVIWTVVFNTQVCNFILEGVGFNADLRNDITIEVVGNIFENKGLLK